MKNKLFPIDVIRSKAQEYVDASLCDHNAAQVMVRTIEAERGGENIFNERHGVTEGEGGVAGEEDDRPIATKLNKRQLAELLEERERQMRQGSTDGEPTDQWRVYSEIVQALQSHRRLRMMIQASAGTGKSFLLTSIYLWCVVHDVAAKAAAPTGIVGALVRIARQF